MTTTAAGNVAGEKEKQEKRRALGRGLSALFTGGPRVVTAPAPAASGSSKQDEQSAPAAVVDQPAVAAELRSAGQPGAAVPTLNPGVRPVPAIISTPPAAVPTVEGDAAGQEQQIPHFVRNDNAVVRNDNLEVAPDEPHDDGPIEIYAVAEERRIPANLVINLAIADIDKNPFQTRYVQDDEALAELAESIKANGVVQPILVRPSDDEEGRYVLILGERRLHASKKAGKTHIPALVRKVSLQQAAEMTIVENLQREDLSPLEQAEAFRVLSQEFSLTQAEIAERVGLSRESVANYMRLLKLPREVMQLLAEKRISFQKAKELLKLGDNDRIAAAALHAVKKGLNIEQIETLVLRMDGLLEPVPGMPGQERKSGGGARWVDPNVRAAQMDLERLLGMRVRIRDRKGKGRIVIEYATVDDYERVVEALRGKK